MTSVTGSAAFIDNFAYREAYVNASRSFFKAKSSPECFSSSESGLTIENQQNLLVNMNDIETTLKIRSEQTYVNSKTLSRSFISSSRIS